MKRILIGFFALIAGFGVQAQLVNDGATIVVKPGATLFVESNVTNNTGGTISVEGTLEVQGDLTNNATMTTATGSLVKFSGTGNSNLKSNGATIVNLELAKTGAANTLTLTDNGNVTTNLNFTSSGGARIVLGASNLIMSSTSTAISGADANEYVYTNSSGAMQKNYANGALSSSVFKFEVGDATNYSPLTASVTGTASSANLQGSVVNADQPNRASTLPEATSYLTRYWNVDQVGITSYSNSVTGQYITADDVVGTQAKIKGSSYSSPNWSFVGAANNVGTPSVTGTITASTADFTGTDALNKLNLTAYLNGAMPSMGTTMTSDLQNYFGGNMGLLPTTSPYGAPTSSYGSINNPGGVAGAVVDWVKVEVRSTSNPSTILETRSLLLKNNGSIVDPNGNVPYFKESTTPVQVVVQHRNHLGIMSNSIASFTGTTGSYDYSSGLAQAYNAGGDPAQMVLKNGKWTMIGGDVNMDLSCDGLDLSATKLAVANGIFDVYVSTDINMDGSVDGIDLTIAKVSVAAGYYSTLINF